MPSLLAPTLAFVTGLLLWTFVEYALHRWVGHMRGGKRAVSREHLQHHATPTYFTPLPRKLALSIPVVGTLAALSTLTCPPWAAGAFTLGFTAGWIGYERLHQTIHQRGPRSTYGRWARMHHLHHHFGSPRKNHGVSTSLWDHVFGTFEAPEVVRIPRRHAEGFPWLLDASATELAVRPAHAADYRFV